MKPKYKIGDIFTSLKGTFVIADIHGYNRLYGSHIYYLCRVGGNTLECERSLSGYAYDNLDALTKIDV